MTSFKAILLLTILTVLGSLTPANPIQRLNNRATNLELALRETKKNTERWHFALVLLGANTQAEGHAFEHLIGDEKDLEKGKCMVFETRDVDRDESKMPIKATIIPSKGETTDTILSEAVLNVARGVPGAMRDQVTSGDFNNCFDFATETARRLGVAGYISGPDAKKFKDYHDTHSAAVKAKMDAGTRRACARDITGSACALSKSSSTLSTSQSAPTGTKSRTSPKKSTPIVHRHSEDGIS
ncbi:hypothetical protein BDP27DRAFT_1318045, partial [Rhodocollybia butyracea]